MAIQHGIPSAYSQRGGSDLRVELLGVPGSVPANSQTTDQFNHLSRYPTPTFDRSREIPAFVPHCCTHSLTERHGVRLIDDT